MNMHLWPGCALSARHLTWHAPQFDACLCARVFRTEHAVANHTLVKRVINVMEMVRGECGGGGLIAYSVTFGPNVQYRQKCTSKHCTQQCKDTGAFITMPCSGRVSSGS
jgi:hypothetical protein